jgi:hypothetical protein
MSGECHFTLPPEESPVGCPEVISCAEVHASKQWEALRQQLHARFDPWLDTLETQWPEPPMTLPEMTAMVWTLRQERPGGLTAPILAQGHRGEYDRQQAPCPQGDRVLKARACVSRTVETMGGPLRFERPYFYCQACHIGHYPFDEAPGVVTGCKQLDMQQAAARLVTDMPYETAQFLLHELTGLSCGSERRYTVRTFFRNFSQFLPADTATHAQSVLSWTQLQLLGRPADSGFCGEAAGGHGSGGRGVAPGVRYPGAARDQVSPRHRGDALKADSSCFATLSMGKRVAELRTSQDMLLPVLPAQEILP